MSAVLLAAIGLRGARAAPGEATVAIQRADARSRELLAAAGDRAALEAEVAALLRQLFDARALVAQALAAHWDRMTAAQQGEIVRLVETLVVRSHIKSLRTYGRFPVEYRSETTEGGLQQVHSVVRSEKRGRPAAISLTWALARDGTSWRVHDLVTDGVSLVANYRSQFNRAIAKEGVAGLIAKLRAKAAAAR